MLAIYGLLCCYIAGKDKSFGFPFEIPALYDFIAIVFPRYGNIFKTQTNQNLSHRIGREGSCNSAGVGYGIVLKILGDILRT